MELPDREVQKLFTGIIWIDNQHRKLFKNLFKLLDAINTGKGAVEVGLILKFVEDYVKAHFSTEAKYMLKYGYPRYKEHMAKHGAYVKTFIDLKKMYILEGASPEFIDQFQSSLINWWYGHIENCDKDFAEFIRKKKISKI